MRFSSIPAKVTQYKEFAQPCAAFLGKPDGCAITSVLLVMWSLGRVTEHRRSWKMLGSWLHRKGAELGWAIPSWTEPFPVAVVPDPDRMVRWFGHVGHHGYVFFTNMTFVCCQYACSGLLSSAAASPRAGGAPVLSQNFGRCPKIPSCASLQYG